VQILVLIDYFLPGEKAGGPISALAALIHHLHTRAEFSVITRDRDLGDRGPYPDVPTNTWVRLGDARCRYLPPATLTPVGIARLLRETDHDLVYLNTLFSAPFSHYPLILRKLRLVPRRPVVLAPRGQLDPGALELKRRKKRVFLGLARHTGLFGGVAWHSTGAEETASIRRWFGADVEVREAPNLRVAPRLPGERGDRLEEGLRIAFLSRISPKKNLLGALEILSGVRAEVTFDVFGPVEDRRYFTRCEQLMAQLPPNVSAQYHGVVKREKVGNALAGYDLLLLPTLGENYGHVIAEALAVGCAPLISDRTPWRGLVRRGVGWDLPLEDRDAFRSVIDSCAAEPAAVRRARSDAATAWMATIDADPEGVRRNASLFGLEAEQRPARA
jgi:glycosyltransferase involved in cell wall biosynthesis